MKKKQTIPAGCPRKNQEFVLPEEAVPLMNLLGDMHDKNPRSMKALLWVIPHLLFPPCREGNWTMAFRGDYKSVKIIPADDRNATLTRVLEKIAGSRRNP